jgi:hypothetical protein
MENPNPLLLFCSTLTIKDGCLVRGRVHVIWMEEPLTLLRFVPLPKSSTPARIQSNAALHDFELDTEDMARLDKLDQGANGAVGWNPVDAP